MPPLRTLSQVAESAAKAIWDYWWFVLVLWVGVKHVTMHAVVQTALIWSGIEIVSVPVRLLIARRLRRRRLRRAWRGYMRTLN